MKVLFCGQDLHYAYVYTKEELSDTDIHVVQCTRDQIAQELTNTDVAIPLLSNLSATVLASASHLKLIIQFGVGVEGIDIPAASSHGIWVSNIPSKDTGNAASCAEMAVFLMLSCLRDVHAMQGSIQKRIVGIPVGGMLQGSSVLVVGFGNIAKELISRLRPFGVKISCLRRNADWGKHTDELSQVAESALVDRGIWPQDVHRLAAHADFIVLTCHLDDSSRGLLGVEFLGSCKQGVRVVNVARGGLMDYDAVLQGLESGKIGAMGLDVQFWEPFDPTDPIAQHPRVFLTPHVAGVTEQSYRAMAKVVAAEARHIRAGMPPTIKLNTPNNPRIPASAN